MEEEEEEIFPFSYYQLSNWLGHGGYVGWHTGIGDEAAAAFAMLINKTCDQNIHPEYAKHHAELHTWKRR